MNGDNTQINPQGSSQAVPAGAGAPSGAGGGVDPRLQQLMQILSTPHKELQQPPVRPQAKTTGLGTDIGLSLLGMFVPFLGQAVQKHVMQQKQSQVDREFSKFKQLHDDLEEAWMLSGGNQEQALQLWEKMPAYRSIFDPQHPESKKNYKNFAKVFQVDFMNPEKTKANASYQGLQKFLTVYPQSKIVKALHGKMQEMGQGQGGQPQGGQPQQGQPQPGQGQQQPPQQSGQPDPMRQGEQLPMSMTKADPKLIEQLLSLGERTQAHQEAMAYHREQLTATITNHQQVMMQRQTEFRAKLAEADIRRTDLRQHYDEQNEYWKELLELKRMELDAKREMGEDTAKEWSELIRHGHPLDEIKDAKTRNATIKFMQQNGISVPRKIPVAEQKFLTDAADTEMKADLWMSRLEAMRDPKTGQLPNQSGAMFKDRFLYMFGRDGDIAGLVSDFSRERYVAIAPLMHGVRRGDILQDMIKHTPNAWIDSISLMHTKLDRLKWNMRASRLSALLSYGYQIDPATGEELGPMMQELKEKGYDLGKDGGINAIPPIGGVPAKGKDIEVSPEDIKP